MLDVDKQRIRWISELEIQTRPSWWPDALPHQASDVSLGA
jgi:hypothetical protein